MKEPDADELVGQAALKQAEQRVADAEQALKDFLDLGLIDNRSSAGRDPAQVGVLAYGARLDELKKDLSKAQVHLDDRKGLAEPPLVLAGPSSPEETAEAQHERRFREQLKMWRDAEKANVAPERQALPTRPLLIGAGFFIAGVVTWSAVALFPRDAPAADAPLNVPPVVTASDAAAAPRAAAAGLRISRFRAVLVPPSTTYTVEVENPGSLPLTYVWDPDIPCGVFQISDGPTAVWVHPHNNNPRSCPDQTSHPGTITVTVTDPIGGKTSYTYTGGSLSANVKVD